ncbi:MAG: hypothetical protein AB7N24_11165 [Dehalococcoidia bacterium]
MTTAQPGQKVARSWLLPRVAAAAALSVGALWLIYLFSDRYDFGVWNSLLGFAALLGGPALLGLALSAPRFPRGAIIRLGGTAALAPAVVWWLFFIPATNDDGTPVKLFIIPVFLVLVMVDSWIAWACGRVVEGAASRDA